MANEAVTVGSRKEQKENTAKKLLSVSLNLFIRRGYGATNIRDIARDAQVSTGLFFHYFSSKEQVLIEHIKMAFGGVAAVLDKLHEARSPIEIFKDITEMILSSMHGEYYRNLYLLVNQVNSMESIPDAVKQIVENKRPIQESVFLIEKGQGSGEFRQGDPLAIALVYWGAMQGVAESLTWNLDLAVPDSSLLMAILTPPQAPVS